MKFLVRRFVVFVEFLDCDLALISFCLLEILKYVYLKKHILILIFSKTTSYNDLRSFLWLIQL